jgi:hypothetical protein
MIQGLMRRSARRANVKAGVHILRHTFCSHLAMRGAPARAIQELAGHQDLGTTQRYMHLSPAALDAAIRLLEAPVDVSREAVDSGGAGNGARIVPVLLKKMVEAPGFAPGSENTSPQESTMRIRLCSVAPGVKKRNNRRAPTPENLAADVQGGRQQPACLNDIQYRPAG